MNTERLLSILIRLGTSFFNAAALTSPILVSTLFSLVLQHQFSEAEAVVGFGFFLW